MVKLHFVVDKWRCVSFKKIGFLFLSILSTACFSHFFQMIYISVSHVQRVLRHKISDLIGMNISKLITSSSQDALAKLIDTLLATDKVASEDGHNESGTSSNSGNTSGAPMVSEQSDQGFPLSVVKVNSYKDGSDSSGNDKVTESMQSKDDADASDPSNLSNANEALDRNVRSHNELLKQKKASKKKSNSHKDDVTGDTVTANNADARLSSLLQPHEPGVKKVASVENLEDMTSSSSDSLLGGVEDKRHKKRNSPENGSDDSGYREDSGSYTSETSNSKYILLCFLIYVLISLLILFYHFLRWS